MNATRCVGAAIGECQSSVIGRVDYTSQQPWNTHILFASGCICDAHLPLLSNLPWPARGRSIPGQNLSSQPGHPEPSTTRLRTLSDIVRQWDPASLGAGPASANALMDGNLRPQHRDSIAYRISKSTPSDYNGFPPSIEGLCTFALASASITDQSCEGGI